MEISVMNQHLFVKTVRHQVVNEQKTEKALRIKEMNNKNRELGPN